MNKQELKNQLNKIELVKPNSIETRMSNEVESLCETYICAGNVGKAAGDTEEENDILF